MGYVVHPKPKSYGTTTSGGSGDFWFVVILIAIVLAIVSASVYFAYKEQESLACEDLVVVELGGCVSGDLLRPAKCAVKYEDGLVRIKDRPSMVGQVDRVCRRTKE